MNVPFLDLHAAYQELKPEIDGAVARVLNSGRYILGEEVEAFESEFSAYVGAGYCIGVGNGFDALALSLKALGVGPGDEVVVPAHTFIATWMAVSDIGATPIPVDVNSKTYTLEPTLIESVITDRTRAIVPVHLYGHPADLDPILALARKYRLAVVEDAAQAHGARYKGQRIGAHGDLVTWSFYPGKNLGAMGDAGGVTTNCSALAQRLRRLSNYGSDKKYIHEEIGRNSRIDPVQAAILRVKLQYLDESNARRQAIAGEYERVLRGTRLTLPVVQDWAEHAWHLYVVRHASRDEVAHELAEQGIQTGKHYPHAVPEQAAYVSRRIGKIDLYKGQLANKLASEVLSLPLYPQMPHTEQTIKSILRVIHDNDQSD